MNPVILAEMRWSSWWKPPTPPLRYDMTGKRDLYARAGVPEYWVLDLKGRKLVVHRNPEQGKYTSTTTLSSRDSVSIGGQSTRVAGMLP